MFLICIWVKPEASSKPSVSLVHLSQSKGTPFCPFLHFLQDCLAVVFIAILKGSGLGEAPFAPLCNFQTPLSEGMESDVSTREAAKLRKRCIFLLRRECSFKGANLSFHGFGGGLMWRLVCVSGT